MAQVGRPPTFRRGVLRELRDINAIMRLAVSRWDSLATQTFDNGVRRKREPHELPENDMAELGRLVTQMKEVARRAAEIGEQSRERMFEVQEARRKDRS